MLRTEREKQNREHVSEKGVLFLPAWDLYKAKPAVKVKVER